MQKNDLTDKQRQVLRFLYKEIKSTNRPPTVREVASHFGFASSGSARDHLKALLKKGYIRVSAANKARSIELVKDAIFRVPILGRIRAGFNSFAVEDIEGFLNLENLVGPDENIFALRVKGDSMIGAGILPDDLVVVRKQTMGQTGEIVVAMIGEEATVKRLAKRERLFFLEPANPAYEPIPVNEDVVIIGKVINVVRRFQ